jgi:hypothetical protein
MTRFWRLSCALAAVIIFIGEYPMTVIRPPTYIVWSTDHVDLSDPFQRRWYIQQVLTHGREEDIKTLDIEEIERIFDELILPPDVHSLWKMYLEYRHAQR